MVPFDIPRETVYRNYQLAAASIFNVLKCVNLGHVVRVPVVSSWVYLRAAGASTSSDVKDSTDLLFTVLFVGLQSVIEKELLSFTSPTVSNKKNPHAFSKTNNCFLCFAVPSCFCLARQTKDLKCKRRWWFSFDLVSSNNRDKCHTVISKLLVYLKWDLVLIK